MSPAAPARLNFFGLPPEIRNRVYEYLFEQNDHAFLPFETRANYPFMKTATAMHAMRASLQLWREVLPVFLENCWFTFRSYETFMTFVGSSTAPMVSIRNVAFRFERLEDFGLLFGIADLCPRRPLTRHEKQYYNDADHFHERRPGTYSPVHVNQFRALLAHKTRGGDLHRVFFQLPLVGAVVELGVGSMSLGDAKKALVEVVSSPSGHLQWPCASAEVFIDDLDQEAIQLEAQEQIAWRNRGQ